MLAYSTKPTAPELLILSEDSVIFRISFHSVKMAFFDTSLLSMLLYLFEYTVWIALYYHVSQTAEYKYFFSLLYLPSWKSLAILLGSDFIASFMIEN